MGSPPSITKSSRMTHHPYTLSLSKWLRVCVLVSSVRSGAVIVLPSNIPTHAVQDSHQKSNQDNERKYDDHAYDGPQQYVTHDAILTRKIEAIGDCHHDVRQSFKETLQSPISLRSGSTNGEGPNGCQLGPADSTSLSMNCGRQNRSSGQARRQPRKDIYANLQSN